MLSFSQFYNYFSLFEFMILSVARSKICLIMATILPLQVETTDDTKRAITLTTMTI